MNEPTASAEHPVERPRPIETVLSGRETSDGAGVRLTRLISQPLHTRLDPFLLFDAFGSEDPDDYIAGFPDHPHRGFETITYMIAGRMRHRDSAGHEGLLESGGVQWMTAGRGVIHSEIPEQEAGRMEGFQLWLNLPAAEKLRAPEYRDFSADDLPGFTTRDGVAVKVIAGASHGVAAEMARAATEPLYLDLHLPAGARFAQRIPAGHNAFVCVYRGAVTILGAAVGALGLAVLANAADADGVIVEATAAARLLLIAGRPLNEPIAQYGPFVMNTRAQIHQAVDDYNNGRLA